MAQATRDPPTVGDYVVTALSPVLIMGLVGSLAFFLLDVLYAGRHPDRLGSTLFWFVLGAVLVGRIGIEGGTARAWMFGLPLGGAAWLAMAKFVDYPPGLAVGGPLINLVIIAVVLWSANKLTWDCTFVDESAEDAGGGLLEEIRDDLQSEPTNRERQRPEEQPTAAPTSTRKARPMGRWVVYFSLAALPLFGLGQALIPTADAGRRRYTFWLMSVYVASGLGLLLTTTLLGLRRYLRQRRLQMPVAMTGLWLGLGAALIAAFLLMATVLPRPNAEYALVRITPVGSPERDASRYARDSEAAGKGDGRGGAKGEGEKSRDGSGGQGQAGGKTPGQNDKPDGQGGDKSGGRGKSDSKSNQGGGDRRQDGKATDDRADNRRVGERPKSGEPARRENQSDQSRQTEPGSAPTPPTSVFGTLATIAKWIVLIVLAILVALVVLWFLARHLAGTAVWARKLFEALSAYWRSLFGGAAPQDGDVVESVVVRERPRPFADFSNPFADGSAAGRSPEELVRYSFTALEAWAFERDLPRRPDETPLEFGDRVADESALGDDARRLVGLYARLAYARRRPPAESRGAVESFWRALARLDSEVPARL